MNNRRKWILGLIISGVFLYFAFKTVDVKELKSSFLRARYIMILPTLLLIFIGHWIRAWRWHYLLKPIKKISLMNLFSALMIGYMGNSILPAHLGEFIRAYVIGRKEGISKSACLATIVIERMIDLITLLIIMMIGLALYPFPDWIIKSGLVLMILTIAALILLIVLKKRSGARSFFSHHIVSKFPGSISKPLSGMMDSFGSGIRRPKNKRDYITITVLSLLIWIGYWLVLYINFYTLHIQGLGITASIVLLIMTTISVVIPSSPGYVGTYHFLCQFSLGLFGVSPAVGLAYAIVIHALNIFSLLFVGMFFAWKEGIRLMKLNQDNRSSETIREHQL